jgi:hypothetical protein
MGTTTEVTQTDSDLLFEMANLFPKHTGLPFVVWISVRGGAQHDVRIKISSTPKAIPSKMTSVAVRPTVHLVGGGDEISGDDLKLLTKWIELNRDVIVRYWEGEMDTKDALDAIQSL